MLKNKHKTLDGFRKAYAMTGPCRFLSIVILVVYSLSIADCVMAASLELDDFSGQTGPAPSPAPYATTNLRMNNTPNNISWFKFRINYNPDVLAAYSVNFDNTLLGDWDYKNVWTVCS